MTDRRAEIPQRLQAAGGLVPGAVATVARDTGVPAAEVFGTGSFYHLLAEPEVELRICQGLSCALAGSAGLLDDARAAGRRAVGCSCLAACDQAPAALRGREVVSARSPAEALGSGLVGPALADRQGLVFDLEGQADFSLAALARARALGPEAVIAELQAAGLQGRGGAGFPAYLKWRSVRDQPPGTRYVVLNADEGEPGTFKDREVLLRRSDLVLEGLAIAAQAIEAEDVYLYLRGEFQAPLRALRAALARFEMTGVWGALRFHIHEGQGAYICGEETALLEALEGKRGQPRLKPPFPTERGLFGRPTLIHNVETIAAVPAIVRRGGAAFRGLGRTGPGTKLYSVSGHVARPGVYELPLGVSLDELALAAGGYVGELMAFSPGGASSGFLPAAERARPLDFAALAEIGSMLGSAGVVVLNDTADMRAAVHTQLAFFEAESCGQCAPCRIGTRFLRLALERGGAADLQPVADVAWEMNEGSICGLGQAAALPLTSALRFFPEAFGR